MAHATGSLDMNSVEVFSTNYNRIFSYMEHINRYFEPYLKSWFEKIIVSCAGGKEYDRYIDLRSLVNIEILIEMSLNKKELSICSKHGVSKFNSKKHENFHLRDRIKKIIKALKEVEEIVKDQ